MIGFELMFSIIRSELISKNDLLISLIHLQCIQKGFLCVGSGEEFPESPENGSELLPNFWNQSQNTYTLRYQNSKTRQKLLIKGVKLSEHLLISALIIGNKYAHSHQIRTDDYISDSFTTFNRAFVSGSVDRVHQDLEKQVINKVLNPNADRRTKTFGESSLKNRPEPDYNSLGVGPLGAQLNPYSMGYFPTQGGQWAPLYRGANLVALGRSQGGILMDPRNFPQPLSRNRNPAPRLTRGAVPPGTRFDPFGPLGTGIGPVKPNHNLRHAGPDPDHLLPPVYNDK